MSANAPAVSGPRAGRREWLGLAVLALPTLLLSLDLSVLYLALPHLSADLGASSVQQLWILDIYGFMVAGLLITMGTLGDRVGRRRLLMTGAAAFGLASVLAAFSTSAEMLIATRAVMGIAGATVMPSTLALISNLFKNPAQRGVAISAWMSCFMGGLLIGPLIGGVMLEFFWWGSVFLLGVPVMVLLLATGPRLLPEYRDPSAGRVDLVSVALSLGAILPVIYGLKELARDGWQAGPLAALAAGVVLGVVFVLRQRGLTHPLLDLRLFGIRILSAAVVLGVVVGALQGGISLLVTQYLQLVEGLSPLKAGLWMMPPSIAMIFGLMLAPGLAQRIRPAYVIAAGLAVSTVGYLVLTQVDGDGGLAVLVTGFGVVLFGVGMPMGLGTALGVGAAPPEKVGSASSLAETGGEFGVALGIAALGSVGTVVYRNQMVDAVPGGIPAEAADAARESIAGAGAVAGQLPAPLAAQLLDPAREAFTSGLTTVAGICAVVMIGLAVLMTALLRQVPPTAEAQADEAGQANKAPVAAH